MPYKSLAQAIRFHRDPDLIEYAPEWDEATRAAGLHWADLPTRMGRRTPRQSVSLARARAVANNHEMRRGAYQPPGRISRRYEARCAKCGGVLVVKPPADDETGEWVPSGKPVTQRCGTKREVRLADGTIFKRAEAA